jgi:chromosome segregation ATPase
MQIGEAQHQLEDVHAVQGTLLPLVGDVRALNAALDATQRRVVVMGKTGALLDAREQRLAELVSASITAEAAVAQGALRVQGLVEELARSGDVKNQLMTDLSQLQHSQGEAVARVQASEDRIERAEEMFQHLERHLTQLAVGEKRLAGIESRLADINQVADRTDLRIESIVTHQRVVRAVEAELEELHRLSASTKADVAHILGQRGELAQLTTHLTHLVSQIAETDEGIAGVEAHRNVGEDVQTRASAVSRTSG